MYCTVLYCTVLCFYILYTHDLSLDLYMIWLLRLPLWLLPYAIASIVQYSMYLQYTVYTVLT